MARPVVVVAHVAVVEVRHAFFRRHVARCVGGGVWWSGRGGGLVWKAEKGERKGRAERRERGEAGMTRKDHCRGSPALPPGKSGARSLLGCRLEGGRGSAGCVCLCCVQGCEGLCPGQAIENKGREGALDAPIAGHIPSNDHKTPTIAPQDTPGRTGRAPEACAWPGLVCFGSGRAQKGEAQKGGGMMMMHEKERQGPFSPCPPSCLPLAMQGTCFYFRIAHKLCPSRGWVVTHNLSQVSLLLTSPPPPPHHAHRPAIEGSKRVLRLAPPRAPRASGPPA